MASDTANVKLGVCRVYLNEVDLGLTQGGVEVTVATDTHKTEVDQFGKTPINEWIMGRTCTVKCPLAETTLETLVAIMPGATLVTDSIDPTKKKVVVTSGVGTDLLALAQPLRLHPVAKLLSDKSEDFLIPLASTAGALNFAYKLDAERIYNCEFTGYPNATTGALFTVGDETAAA